MTCIAGIEHNGHVYLGGDSAGVYVSQLSINSRADEKVFRNGDFVMGFTSSFRMGQLLRYAFHPPEQSSKKDDMCYLVTDFVDDVRKMFREKGWLELDNNVETGGTFLLGYKGKLYTIENDFQVSRVHDGYSSVGCGYAYALGSLASTEAIVTPDGAKLHPNERLKIALETAAKFSCGVRAPFVYVSSEK